MADTSVSTPKSDISRSPLFI